MWTGWVGLRRLHHGADRSGRLFLTLGAAGVLAGLLAVGRGDNLSMHAVALGVVVAPLWFASSARRWFGEPPIDLTGSAQA